MSKSGKKSPRKCKKRIKKFIKKQQFFGKKSIKTNNYVYFCVGERKIEYVPRFGTTLS